MGQNDKKIRGILLTRKGQFTYEYFRHYNQTEKFDTYAFLIWDEKDCSGKQKADFSLLIMDDGIHLKVIDLFTKDYQCKGIAVSIILKAKEIFGKRIISSSNTKKNFRGEANWSQAVERIWLPLSEQGLAFYNAENDYFELL
jgi:hypothetical protein